MSISIQYLSKTTGMSVVKKEVETIEQAKRFYDRCTSVNTACLIVDAKRNVMFINDLANANLNEFDVRSYTVCAFHNKTNKSHKYLNVDAALSAFERIKAMNVPVFVLDKEDRVIRKSK